MLWCVGDNAQQKKRMQQQKKYEEESMALQEELTLELYTLETKNGDLWGPHSFEALSSLVERCDCDGMFFAAKFLCSLCHAVFDIVASAYVTVAEACVTLSISHHQACALLAQYCGNLSAFL